MHSTIYPERVKISQTLFPEDQKIFTYSLTCILDDALVELVHLLPEKLGVIFCGTERGHLIGYVECLKAKTLEGVRGEMLQVKI